MSTVAACASEVIASSLAQRYKKRLFNVCAIETRKKIIEEISDEAYAILADEPGDISHKNNLLFACSLLISHEGHVSILLELFM
jgi:hypothetical protein